MRLRHGCQGDSLVTSARRSTSGLPLQGRFRSWEPQSPRHRRSGAGEGKLPDLQAGERGWAAPGSAGPAGLVVGLRGALTVLWSLSPPS